METLLSSLQQALTADENLLVNDLLRQIQNEKLKIESSEFTDWQQRLLHVADCRLRSSSTLKRGEIQLWQQANIYVENKIRSRRLPTWQDICHINGLLTEKEDMAVVRTEDIYVGPWSACKTDQLKFHIDFFCENILSIDHHQHPLVAAALVQYWIASIHPFCDANGRTAVLIADWIANYFGYFPQVFDTQLDAVIAHFSDRHTVATPARAIHKVLGNFLRSYHLFLGID